MDVDLFLPEGPALKSLETALAAYGPVLRVRRHPAGESELLPGLWHASFPLDASTGHTAGPWAGSPPTGYGGYYRGREEDLPGQAVAFFGRVALIDGVGALPIPIRPGVWSVRFADPDQVRGAVYQALISALRELRAACRRFRELHPRAGLHETADALEVTPAALLRALETF